MTIKLTSNLRLAAVSVAAAALTLLSAGTSAAAPYTDTVEAPLGYFTPTPADTTNSPYYRGFGQDWGYTHGAIAGAFTTATLNISAFDVDAAQGEIDKIYAYDNGVLTEIGSLAGANDIYSFTNFNLGANFFDDIASGLQVFMKIDVNDDGWLVSLAKSSLSVDNGSLPNPNPGGVPEPATWAMMIIGFGAVGSMVRNNRRRNVFAAA
ncbi:MAG: PEPxxWA-CTERM sorting domain-containing protein [Pseudomonadota bacterium]|uniref:PEPxxWA-CTERM sorting domain-containing protein n=1 Tax=Phenylobacterium sp. TaxID=1871053 RepID=UPI0025F87AC7|nr:PEPxxWA-CTERM sorting domain-containing protein [Phenylobacterium sp.]MBT9470020.1 PEPxxWA-CTERM sorting domain-containing protein [Phenylobacterium sp.]